MSQSELPDVSRDSIQKNGGAPDASRGWRVVQVVVDNFELNPLQPSNVGGDGGEDLKVLAEAYASGFNVGLFKTPSDEEFLQRVATSNVTPFSGSKAAIHVEEEVR